MTTLRSIFIAVASLSAFTALACESPPVVMVPDGASATTEQLLDVQGKVREYMEAMEVYLACINDEIEAAGGEENAPPDYMTLMITRYNTAVDEMEALAASFNEEVRAHRAANPDD